MSYDYIIVGGGPSGLTLAYILGKLNKKCLLIDKNKTLGGCHRVTNYDGYFSEHGPRIYSSAYLNMIMILNDMGYKFEDLFVPYDFSISEIGGKSIGQMRRTDLFLFVIEFFKLIFGCEGSKEVSMRDFMDTHNFSSETKDYVDRLCRLTDGAGSDRYTLFEFLQLANQQGLYKIYQPKFPNDIGLIKIWEDAILKTRNVSIMVDTNLESLIYDGDKISGIIVNSNGVQTEYPCRKVLLAVPPKNLMNILVDSDDKNISDSFGDYREIREWASEHEYINDISISFHWSEKLRLPKVWGFPKSDWGVAFIILSDYMTFPKSGTVISTCTTMNDVKSHVTNKTVNESSLEEIRDEVFRQLGGTFLSLPKWDVICINDGIKKINGEWTNPDSAFISTTQDKYLDPQSNIKNLYSIGTHNGKHLYHFTSMESAITNALDLIHTLEPQSKIKYPIKILYSLVYLVRLSILFLVCIIFIRKYHRILIDI